MNLPPAWRVAVWEFGEGRRFGIRPRRAATAAVRSATTWALLRAAVRLGTVKPRSRCSLGAGRHLGADCPGRHTIGFDTPGWPIPEWEQR